MMIQHCPLHTARSPCISWAVSDPVWRCWAPAELISPGASSLQKTSPGPGSGSAGSWGSAWLPLPVWAARAVPAPKEELCKGAENEAEQEPDPISQFLGVYWGLTGGWENVLCSPRPCTHLLALLFYSWQTSAKSFLFQQNSISIIKPYQVLFSILETTISPNTDMHFSQS